MPDPGDRPSLPSVQFHEFEGPLDLLLDEVRRQNVEIDQIAMAPIVSSFLDYLGKAAERNLNLDIDWLHTAATLIHWKSRSLLPSEAGGECEPDRIRDSLVQQLLEHRKQAAEELGRRRSVEQGRFSRPSEKTLGEQSVDTGDAPFLSVWDMIQAARGLAGWVDKHREEQRQWQELGVEADDVTVSQMVDYLRTQLPSGTSDRVEVGKLLLEQPTSGHRACLFLGMLEMARGQELELDQSETFGPLWISIR